MPHAEHVPTIRELEALSANENDGKAGFRLVDSRDHVNGVATYRDNNVLTGEISNLGREDHTFTLEVSYAGGKTWRKKFTVKGIPLDDVASASPKAHRLHPREPARGFPRFLPAGVVPCDQ